MNKQQAWDKLKERSPETADFLADMAKKFGKPQIIEIEIEGETYVRGSEADILGNDKRDARYRIHRKRAGKPATKIQFQGDR